MSAQKKTACASKRRNAKVHMLKRTERKVRTRPYRIIGENKRGNPCDGRRKQRQGRKKKIPSALRRGAED